MIIDSHLGALSGGKRRLGRSETLNQNELKLMKNYEQF